jgi:signal transduction histidine kinase
VIARRPTLTIRAHLAVVYGITFTLAATVLSVTVYLLMTAVLTPASVPPAPAAPVVMPTPRALGGAAEQEAGSLRSVVLAAGLALAFGVLVASVLGWVVAGRMLAPIRRITAIARETASRSLHARVALTGPRDEITELADTFDGMLTRLERAFEAQRRFAANASHELLTPLTTSRALLSMAAANPETCDVRVLTEQLLSVNRQSERLVDTLLELARAEHGVVQATPTDLALVTEKALDEIRTEAEQRSLTIEVRSAPVHVNGDPALLECLVVNLLRNAVRHNHAGGRVVIRVIRGIGGPRLTVGNTGEEVPVDRLDELFEPFVRAAPRTRGHQDSHGLGLAIIRAIAEAHRSTVTAEANPGGGLTVTVHFREPDHTER